MSAKARVAALNGAGAFNGSADTTVQVRRWSALVARAGLITPALATLLGGCTLTAPGCRNHIVRAAIEKEGAESFLTFMHTYEAKVNFALPDDAFILQDTYETSASGDTRACSGKLVARDASPELAMLINYEVIHGEGGQVLYRWDNDSFGKSFFAVVSLQAVRNSMQPAAPHATAMPATPSAGASASLPTSDDQAAAMKRWKHSVHQVIGVQAGNLTDMPSGAQAFAFLVGADGTISNVRPVGPAANSALIEKATAFLQTLNLPKPPGGQRIPVTIKLKFS